MWKALWKEHMGVPVTRMANGALESDLLNRPRFTKAFQQCNRQRNAEWMQMMEDLGSEHPYFVQLSIVLQDLQTGLQESKKVETKPAAIRNGQDLSMEACDED